MHPHADLTLFLEQIRQEAARARSSPAPELTFRLWRRFADTGDRLSYERAYFDRRRRLSALLLDTHLNADPRPSTDDSDHDTALHDLIWSICNERSWVLPAHEPGPVDLFAAETAQTLAEAIPLLGSRLSPRVRERIRMEVHDRVLRHLAPDAPVQWWESAPHNWSAVCAGACGLAALALNADGLPAILSRVEAALAAFQSGFGPDGACLEGGDYWTYGYGYFVYFAEAMRERTGRDLLAGTDHIAAYPAMIDFGDGSRPAFADSSPRASYPAGLLARLHTRLAAPLPSNPPTPSFHDDPCYRWAHLSRTLWWTSDTGPDTETASTTQPPPNPVPLNPAPARSYLPDAQILVLRSPGACFAAKGGHNDEPHNHLDLGHFVLHINGETVLDDLGAPEYTRDYFRSDRYEALQASALSHSIPIINGVTQQPGRRHRGIVLHPMYPSDSPDCFALNLTLAYDSPSLRRFIRRFDWQPSELALTDDFAFTSRMGMVEELFISRLQPVVTATTVTWGPARLTTPPGWSATAEELSVRNHDGLTEIVHRVRLSATVRSGAHTFLFQW